MIQEIVNREAMKIGGAKGCPIAPFLYHLYDKHGCLTDREKAKLEKPTLPPADRSPGKARKLRPDERNQPEERRKRQEKPGGTSPRPEERRKRREDPEGRQPGGRSPLDGGKAKGENGTGRERETGRRGSLRARPGTAAAEAEAGHPE